MIKYNTVEENKIMINECLLQIDESNEIIDNLNIWPTKKYNNEEKIKTEKRKIQININKIKKLEANIRQIERKERLEEINIDKNKIDKIRYCKILTDLNDIEKIMNNEIKLKEE